MKEQPPAPARRVSREELHALVWESPMSHLATEFGVSGQHLAKICRQWGIPCPRPGHWNKKAAGKPVAIPALPPLPTYAPEWLDISPAPSRQAAPPEPAAAAAATAGDIPALDTLDHLHPKVKAWIDEHRREQRQREQDHRKRKTDPWHSAKPLLPDLTERDLYRFRATSVIFRTVQKAGGKIEDAPITGWVKFLVKGQRIECSIVEKMSRSLKAPGAVTPAWSAYPDHHQRGLQSSSLLRVAITTFLPGRQPQWIETPDQKILDLLPAITNTIIGAAPILIEAKREREESARRYQEEQFRRHEQKRLQEVDDGRWSRFRELASDWEKRSLLLAFVAELERRLETEEDGIVGERRLSEWVNWAKERVGVIDPLGQGLGGMFERLLR